MNIIDLKTLMKPPLEGSPFVEMKTTHRLVLIGIITIELIIQFFCYLNSTTPGESWASLGMIAETILLYLPIFYWRSTYGWFHPLIFIPLFSLVRNLPTFIPYLVKLFTEGPFELYYTPASNRALIGWTTEDLTWLNAYASLITIISLVAYYLGFFIYRTPKVPNLKLRPVRNIGIKTMIVVLFCLLIFTLFIQVNGGLAQHLANNWKGGRHANLAGEYYWGFIFNFSRIACYIWLAFEPKAIRQPLFLGCFGTSLLMMFLFSGSRGSVVYSIIIAIIIWMLRRRKFSYTKVVTVLLISVLGIGLLGAFRAVVQARGIIDLTTLTNFGKALEVSIGSDEAAGELTGARLGGPLPILANVPEREEYLYGSTYLALLTLPVPRALWAEKPGLCGGRAAKTFYFNRAKWAIPCGSIGEAYWNFGIFGVMGVFFAYGYFHKWLVKWFKKYPLEPLIIVAYAGVLFFVRPDTSAIIKALQFIIPVFILICLWGGIRLGKTRA